MEALQTVFDTIMGVLEIIKKFFEELFGKKEEAEGEEEVTPAE